MAGPVTSPERTVLPNGLTVVAAPVRSAPVFTAMLVVEAGSRYDPPGGSGTAAVAGGLLLEDTSTRSAASVALAVDSLGSTIDAVTGYETTAIIAGGLVEHCGETLSLLAEVATSPLFSDSSVSEGIRRHLSELAADEGQAYDVCRRSFMRTIFEGHPRANPVGGVSETVSRLSPRDIKSFHEGHYVPARSVLAIAGDMETDALLDCAAKSFGRWPGRPGDPAEPPEPARRLGRRLSTTVMDSSQQHIIIGNLAIARSDPLYYATSVMDVILGDSAGFGSRLSTRLREEQGLAYVVESDATGTAGLEPGVFWAYTAASPRHFEPLVTGLMKELRRVRNEPPTDDEVESAIGYLVGRDLLDRETSDAIAARLVHAERHGLGLDNDARFPELVASVTREDVLEAARRVIDPDGCAFVTVGPVAPEDTSLLDRD